MLAGPEQAVIAPSWEARHLLRARPREDSDVIRRLERPWFSPEVRISPGPVTRHERTCGSRGSAHGRGRSVVDAVASDRARGFRREVASLACLTQ